MEIKIIFYLVQTLITFIRIFISKNVTCRYISF